MNFLKKYINPINDNKFILAFIMMFLNTCSKHIDLKLSKTQEYILQNTIAREIIIFLILFVGTRDVILSLFLTLFFYILTEYIFNENSRFCLFSNHINRIKDVMMQKESDVTEQELNNALELLKRAEKNNQLERQNKFIHFMKNNKL